MTTNSWYHRVFDKFDRIRSTRIFCVTNVSVVRYSGDRIDYNIFENRSKADSVIDLWLFFFRKVNTFGIATAFEIEDARRTPAMLVISNESSQWISRQRSFTSPGESEEKC